MGSSGGIPDIGVWLTAQGVQDVINAFARVRTEGKKTGEDTSAGMDLLNASLSTLGTLLPAITFAAAAGGLAMLVKSSIDSAVNMEKLSQKTGVSVGTLSVFSLAAKETGVDTDALSKALGKLAKGSQDAADGSVKQAKGFKDLGISIQDINSKDPGALFIEIATKLQGIQSPALKAQAVMALFGRAGLELIPVLDKIGTEGFDALKAKAERFGVYMGGELAANAMAAKSGLADVGLIAEGVGLQFTSGLLPAITGIANAFADMAGGASGFKEVGVEIGHGLINVAGAFDLIWKDAIVGLTTFDIALRKVMLAFDDWQSKHALTQVARDSGAEGAARQSAAIANSMDARNNAKIGYAASTRSLAQGEYDLDHPKPAPPTTPSLGAAGDGKTKDDSAKIAAAKLAYEKSLEDNLLAIHKAANAAEEAEDARMYADGLLSVDAYYDKMEARVKLNGDQELADLQKKYQIEVASQPKDQEAQYKKQQEEAQILSKITELQIKQTGDLAKAEDGRAKAKHDLALKELEDEKKMQAATGDTFGAEQTGLQIEIQQYSELLSKRNELTEAQKQAALDDYRVKGEAKIGFGQNDAEAGRVQQGMSQQIADVQDQAANGTITQVAAQAQILQIEKDQLAVLIPLAAVMKEQADASGDPALIAKWAALNEQIKHVASTMKDVTTAQTYLFNQLTTQGRTDFENFFGSIVSGTATASDAFKTLAQDFEKMVGDMVAKLLIFYALEAILGWVAPDSSFLSNLTAAGPFGKYADGGWTGGSAGKAAGIVHGEEFVVRAGPAAANRALLEALNAGTSLGAIRSPSSYTTASSYADSTSSDSGGGMPPAPQINITTPPNTNTQTKQSTGPGGINLTQIIISTISQDMAGGGQTAKTVETTYGLARSGVKRG